MEEKEKPDFVITFRKKKQWINVYLWDVHPATFKNWGGGRWGYFSSEWENPKKGLLGELHFVKSRINRIDLVVHEIEHARVEWMRANNITITKSNEEKMTILLDELVRKFYREYNKIKEK